MKKDKFYINPGDEVSVEKASLIGYVFLGILPISIIGGTIYLSLYLEEEDLITKIQSFIGFALSFVFGWVCWSICVTNWKIWAYSRVRDIKGLKREAESDKLI